MATETAMPPTSSEDLEQALQTLHQNADRFVELTIDERLTLLRRLLSGFESVAERSVQAACIAKGLDFEAAVSGEEWLAGPVLIVRNLRLLIRTLESIKRTGYPPLPPTKTLENGQLAVRVFPAGLFDGLLFAGFHAWTWMEPGITQETLRDHLASPYRSPPDKGRISLVLGAGNVASIPPMDAFYKLFHEFHVVILKMNPVNEYLGPFFEEACKCLIDEGFLRIVYGGAEVGSILVEHPLIDDIHITGSDETHDLIVWGAKGTDRDQRRRSNTPRIQKEVTSELGNVSPVLVVPGTFSDQELEFQAQNVASMLTNNGGFNCNAAKVLVTSRNWSQRAEFLTLLTTTLRSIPPRKAYYPGARDRHAAYIHGRNDVRLLGDAAGDELPWTLIPGVDPFQKNDICFQREAFCSILAETPIDTTTCEEFIAKASQFCNDHIWGTLNISIIVPRSLEKDPTFVSALNTAVTDLRYGTIAINHWPALGYGFVSTPWGGYSGATLQDVQSGRGFVHNTYMLEGIQKTVISGPSIVKPRPAWFRTNRNTHRIARRMVQFEARPGWFKLPGILLEAMHG